MSLNIPLHFKSFSLLSGKLYTTDYQSFIGMVYQNTPPYLPYAAHCSKIYDILFVSSRSS